VTVQEQMGVLAHDGERRSVRFERRFEADAQELWSALVEPDRLRGWLAEALVDARPGGTVELRFGDWSGGAELRGAIRVFDPPRVLEYDWVFAGEPASVVRFELRPAGGETTLVVEHRLLSAEAGTGYAAGWHAHLDLLKEELADGVSSDWQERFDAHLPSYVRQAAALTS
jgi:uncharacterized protein YndB with AHSA1/START domain